MIFLNWHLGLGDAIICNGLVREMAKQKRICIPSYIHNFNSVSLMFSDCKNICVYPVQDELQMMYLSDFAANDGNTSLGIGYYSRDEFNDKKWAEEFYRHARVPWECRWSSFKVELNAPKGAIGGIVHPYAFVHNDPERSFCIKMEKLPLGKTLFPHKADTIFDWCKALIEAEEVHLINSSFLCLADSLPLKAKRKVLHQYARPDGVPPTLREGWEILT